VDLQEPTITAPYGDVEDQVKGLIEGRIDISGPAPWIYEESVVLGLIGEVASLPEVFLAFEVQV
jgi:hypothetical protein